MTRTTMKDVADLAGVSMKSVSRVINGEPNVTEKLRKKVVSAISTLGYVPDLAARSLAGARAFVIGILFDNPSPHYTMKVQAGAYQACRENGYHLLVETLDSQAADAADQLKSALLNSRIDGLVLTPPISECEPVLALLDARAIPYARIAPFGEYERSPYVSIDDTMAGSEMARHFWTLGHRRFGIVNGPPAHGAAVARRQGFLNFLKTKKEVTVAESYGGFHFEGGIDAAKALMATANPPTAIFATNDDSAAGALTGLAQLGLNVPGDVSVAGFDDSWIAKSVWPNLTTVYQPISEMAHAAAMIVIRANGQKKLTSVTFDYDIVVRGSTAAARRDAK